MRFVFKRLLCSVKLFVPSVQRGSWYMITAADQICIFPLSEQRNGSIFCFYKVWTISYVLCYTFHSDWVLSVGFLFVVNLFYQNSITFSIPFCLTSIVNLHTKEMIFNKILALFSWFRYNEYAWGRNTLNLKHCILVFIPVYESEPE